jgi:cytochrome c oxidase cbb3-type subunit 3
MIFNTVFLYNVTVLDMLVVMVLLMTIIVSIQGFEIYLELKRLKEQKDASSETVPVRKTTWLDLFRRKGISMDKFVEGHTYDGIQEYDNSPPAWLNWLFYVSIGAAFCYMMYFHVLKIGDLQTAEYEKQVKEAAPLLAKAQENAIILADQPRLSDDASLIKGKEVFKTYCTSCHGDQAQGIVGPNLTDNYWLHGGKYPEIFKTIFNGVPEKGMLSWKKTLQPQDIRAVASFVFSLKGTNPASPKPPQGVDENGKSGDETESTAQGAGSVSSNNK